MKLILILFTMVAYAEQPGPRVPDEMIVIDAGATNVPTAFDTTGGSQVKIGMEDQTRIQLFSRADKDIEVSLSPSPCGASSKKMFLLPKDGGSNDISAVRSLKNVCFRSAEGTPVTTGKIYISAW